MNRTILYIGAFSAVVSLIGTMLGAFFGIIIKNPTKKLLGEIMGGAAGLMTAIIFLELIPDAMERSGFIGSLVIMLVAIFAIACTDYLSDEAKTGISKGKKVAFLMGLGLMLHNFPEGIIMGFGFVKEANLGIKMSVLIALHDIPEGIAIAASLIATKTSKLKVLWYAFLVALPTTFGAWFGIVAGSISQSFLGGCIAFASGVMVYVVFGQMIGSSRDMCGDKPSIISLIIGIMFGFVMINVI